MTSTRSKIRQDLRMYPESTSAEIASRIKVDADKVSSAISSLVGCQGSVKRVKVKGAYARYSMIETAVDAYEIRGLIPKIECLKEVQKKTPAKYRGIVAGILKDYEQLLQITNAKKAIV